MWIAALHTPAFAQDAMEIQLANEYLLKGEKQKALASYQQLAKKPENISVIHNDYFNLMLDMAQFKQAENYVERLIKTNEKLTYRLDLGVIYQRQGDLQKTEKYFAQLIKQSADDVFKLKTISDYLSSRDLATYSAAALLQARQSSSNPTMFTLELANLYRLMGKRNDMVAEYLNFVTQTPGNISYVKNLLQALLTKPEELEALETVLYSRVQQAPDNENYAELLIWVNLQQKNFEGAFIQARAFDKRFKKENSKSYDLAQIAFNNKDFATAEKSYSFVAKEYANGSSFLPATLGLLRTKEAKLKEQYPISADSVRSMIINYEQFIKTYPDNPHSFEAQESQALLYGYYLGDKDKAIEILTALIANPKATSTLLKSKAKLDLGDLFLFKLQPWEASLLYSQVEKSQKETPQAYDAKLRNAKLSYYIGDFKLAEEHLDILKKATTREIANDALELSLRIKENSAEDTLATALKKYAAIELLLYQNKITEGLQKIDELKTQEGEGDTNKMKTSTLLDDVYWLEANLRLKNGEFKKSISLLQQIADFYAADVLADDAYFLQGDIYEKQLADKPKAMEIFRDFLNKYPGSVYSSEARQRYRKLRGDFEPTKQIN